jgi:hypothetical protein
MEEKDIMANSAPVMREIFRISLLVEVDYMRISFC